MISIIVPEAPRSPPGAEIAAGLFRPTSPPIYSIRAFDHLLPSSFSSSFPSRERKRDFSSSHADESRFEAPLLSIESRRLAKNRRPLRVPLLHPPINFYDAGEQASSETSV